MGVQERIAPNSYDGFYSNGSPYRLPPLGLSPSHTNRTPSDINSSYSSNFSTVNGKLNRSNSDRYSPGIKASSTPVTKHRRASGACPPVGSGLLYFDGEKMTMSNGSTSVMENIDEIETNGFNSELATSVSDPSNSTPSTTIISSRPHSPPPPLPALHRNRSPPAVRMANGHFPLKHRTSKALMPHPKADLSSGNVVEIRDVYKGYRNNPVLTGLNLTVPRGAIYGLLGPSGCGKTTLLRCILGRLSIKNGYVKVFGHVPGAEGSGVPGKRVGYMPQEIALFEEFTIRETLQYFGRIFNMKNSHLERRMEFLISFLHLPTESRFVKTLSGGQKRRVSFAVALLQEPPLLILDEPTVGVDPLLRQNIWEHLVTIANGGETTIIVTTHYIEEARQAHMVGLMRNGRLLAEAPPEDLIIQHNLPTLEDVFLKLCMNDRRYGGTENVAFTETEENQTNNQVELGLSKQTPMAHLDVVASNMTPVNGTYKNVDCIETTNIKNGIIYPSFQPLHVSTEVLVKDRKVHDAFDYSNGDSPNAGGSTCSSLTRSGKKPDKSFSSNLPRPRHIYALTLKNCIKMWRNAGFLLFQFFLPALQIILFCLAIGRPPTDIPVAVYNAEPEVPGGINLPHRFLEHLDANYLSIIHYPDLDSAIQSVKDGNSWAVLAIPENFTDNILSRMYQCVGVEDSVVNGSTIRVYMDTTNQQIAFSIQEKLLNGFQNFTSTMLAESGNNPMLGQLPLVFEVPIYGSRDPNLTEFMAPGIILSVTYIMAVGLTALSFVLERKEGLIDRTWVAGVSNTEVLMAHFFTQFCVVIVQVGLSLIFMILVFNIPCHGPPLWVVILTTLQGMTGMSYGLVISAICDQENSAIMFALGSFYPNILLSGIIWPIEGMPVFLRYVSYVMPQTYPSQALRDLLSRGWGITYMEVWRGHLVSVGWMFAFLFLAGLFTRLRRQ